MGSPDGAAPRPVTHLVIAIAAAGVTQLAVFYLDLGWFVHYLWVLGGMSAAVITWRAWGRGPGSNRGRLVSATFG